MDCPQLQGICRFFLAGTAFFLVGLFLFNLLLPITNLYACPLKSLSFFCPHLTLTPFFLPTSHSPFPTLPSSLFLCPPSLSLSCFYLFQKLSKVNKSLQPSLSSYTHTRIHSHTHTVPPTRNSCLSCLPLPLSPSLHFSSYSQIHLVCV